MKLPRDGVIESFDVADGVGSIRLDDQQTLRFGRSACSFDVAPGVAVRVLEVKPGVANQMRAVRIELRSSVSEHEQLLTARDVAHGVRSATDSGTSSPQDLTAARFAILTHRMLSDRAALRGLWTDAGLDDALPLRFDPSPSITVGPHTYHLTFGASDDSLLDLRLSPPEHSLGASFVAFWCGTPELATPADTERSGSWGFGPDGDARTVMAIIAKLARSSAATGVVLSGAGALHLANEEWLRRAGAIDAPNNIPVEAFVDIAYGPADPVTGERHMMTYGMWKSLALPDVQVVDAFAMHDDDRHYTCESVIWWAARMLAGEDATRASPPGVALPIGQTVGLEDTHGSITFRVLGFADADETLLRVGDVQRVTS